MVPVLTYTVWHYFDWAWPDIGRLAVTLLIGVAIGGVLFAAGLCLSSEQPRHYIKDSLTGLRLAAQKPENIGLLASQAVFILYEELIWRVFLTNALQPLLPFYLIIPITAFLFWNVHEESRPVGARSLEFLLFSLALGGLYVYSQSFVLVCAVHAARNLLILAAHWQQDSDTQTISD